MHDPSPAMNQPYPSPAFSLTGWGLATIIGLTFLGNPVLTAQIKRVDHSAERKKMVELYVRGAGVQNERVLQSMLDTPRHEFMPRNVQDKAYFDAGVPIGEGQTISSPFIVAYMTQALDPQPDDRVLEIGTGSGYQAAVLSPLVKDVFTIEIVESLGKQAERTLQKLKYNNVFVKIGDGYQGWPEHAPFDKIIVTCSPEDVPQPLVDQLKDGGLMVIPVGERHQQSLNLMRKKGSELIVESLQPTLFVPMTGVAEDQRQRRSDPARPALLNGDFEDDLPENGHVAGWYYQRQLEWKTDQLAPSGTHYVEFRNQTPLLAAHLMQGFAIDGGEVERLKMSASIKLEDVRPGPYKDDLPSVAVTFYDANRKDLGTSLIGPLSGSRPWERHEQEVRVPVEAREAIVRIGLFGSTGSASFDNVQIRRVD